MDVINVQFEDEKREVVVAAFSTPQDTTAWNYQGTVSMDDPRYREFRARLEPSMNMELSTSTPAYMRALSFFR